MLSFENPSMYANKFVVITDTIPHSPTKGSKKVMPTNNTAKTLFFAKKTSE